MPAFASRPQPIRQPFRGSFVHSLSCAWSGFRYAAATQRNIRLHLMAAAAAISLALWVRLPVFQLVLIIALCALVLFAELMNTALECLLDHHVGTEIDPTVKIIKDIAAASVLIVALAAAAIGTALFVPQLKPAVFHLGGLLERWHAAASMAVLLGR